MNSIIFRVAITCIALGIGMQSSAASNSKNNGLTDTALQFASNVVSSGIQYGSEEIWKRAMKCHRNKEYQRGFGHFKRAIDLGYQPEEKILQSLSASVKDLVAHETAKDFLEDARKQYANGDFYEAALLYQKAQSMRKKAEVQQKRKTNNMQGAESDFTGYASELAKHQAQDSRNAFYGLKELDRTCREIYKKRQLSIQDDKIMQLYAQHPQLFTAAAADLMKRYDQWATERPVLFQNREGAKRIVGSDIRPSIQNELKQKVALIAQPHALLAYCRCMNSPHFDKMVKQLENTVKPGYTKWQNGFTRLLTGDLFSNALAAYYVEQHKSTQQITSPSSSRNRPSPLTRINESTEQFNQQQQPNDRQNPLAFVQKHPVETFAAGSVLVLLGYLVWQRSGSSSDAQ